MFQPNYKNSKAVIEVAKKKLLTSKFAWLGVTDDVEGIWKGPPRPPRVPRPWKYDSNNFKLEWANWDINEPNNLWYGPGSPNNDVIIKKTSGSIILTSNLLLLNESKSYTRQA